jgi:hypothetical protein
MYYGRVLSHVGGYTRELDLTFHEKKILHLRGYWKTILFQQLQVTMILVDHETGCVKKINSLPFHAYKERPNRMSYASCALI